MKKNEAFASEDEKLKSKCQTLSDVHKKLVQDHERLNPKMLKLR
jgi:hypothetical protein